MSRALRHAGGLVLAAAVTLGIAALSRVPFTASADDAALIRLSWRTPGAFVEECRRPTQDELARLPVHMRREEICEGRILRYRLHVLVNGAVVHDELVRPAGAREDRPLFVYREIPVRPGAYRVDIDWAREDVAAAALDPDAATAGEDVRPGATARATTTPEHLRLAADLMLEPGDIALLTYDVDTQRLVARGRGVVRE